MDRIKKILHLNTTSSIGGAEQMIIDLAEQTSLDKFRTYVSVLREGELLSELRRRHVKFIWLKESTRVYDYKFLRNIVELIRQNRIDLIHSHTWGTDFYGYWGSKISGIPMISTIHDRYYIFEKWTRRLSYRLFINHIKKIVAVSKDIKGLLIDELKISSQKVRLIYNGINTLKFQTVENLDMIRDELDLGRHDLVIGNVGNLREVKDHRTLITAFSKIVPLFPRSKLLIVGEGKLKPDLKKLCEELGLGERVLFLGHREDVPFILSLLDVFILPSVSEGCSLSLLEAMAAGKAVVATNVGGNPELVLNGKTGILVPPSQPDQLAEKMIHLLSNEDLRKKMGAEGRKRVKQKFSRESMVKNYEELYSRILR
ncbi:MAG TPA: glycosyltransferase family 4 protein [Terriglobales bacterium]|nr:glycosyltransferase family 4 protein [Terriglobales bacterium]